MPSRPDEVLLAPRTLAVMHLQVGDRVPLSGNSGTTTFTVTGAGLVVQGPHNGYADGGWVTGGGYDSIFTGFKYRFVLATLREGARGPDAAAALTADVAASSPALADVSLEAPDVPLEIAELRQVRVLPIVLGSFLALLAVGAVGHALATAVRRRARDIAVLRALGMTRWQCRWVVGTQATVLAAIGIVFGLPVGLAVGRTVWRAVADYTPLEYVPPVAVLALVLVGPAALLLANLLAAWPGNRAARLRVAAVLRAE
jgi:predicted lysophospholipase L1 biosynthesis ABC-type transport system permease subunit